MASLLAATIGIIGGTYLFFRQFLGWFLERVSRGSTYLEGSRVLWVSSLRSSIRGNTMMLTFITLFSMTLIFLVSFVAINYTVHFYSAEKEFPNHIAFASQNEQKTQQIEALIKESHPITHHLTIKGLPAKPVSDKAIAFGGSNEYADEILLFSASQYNELVRIRGGDQQVELKAQDAVALLPNMPHPIKFTGANQPEFIVSLKNETKFHLVEQKNYTLLSKATDSNGDVGKKPSTIIISDQAYNRLKQEMTAASFEIYQIEDARNSTALSHQVHDLILQTPGTYYAAFVDLYSIDIETSSMLLFSAAFLAVIALFALGSVIYFKQLREATEEQKPYAILRQLGVDDHEIKVVVRKQLLFVFLPPLLLGMLHSWFLLIYPGMGEVSDFPQIKAITPTVLVLYFAIYILFYLSSTSVYYKIVNPKNAMS